MKNTLNLYHIFYTTAKIGSISGAAKALFLSQPAVSKAIARLEESFPGPLLFRSSKGIRLTKAGEILYHRLEVAFGAIQAGEEELLQRNVAGRTTLSIGASATLCNYILLPLLKTYLASYPHIRVSLVCQSSKETIQQVEQGRLDLGLIGEAGQIDSLSFHRLGAITDTFVASPAYLSRLMDWEVPLSGEGFFLEEGLFPLATFLMLDSANSTRQYVDKHLLLRRCNPQHLMEATTMELLISFAKTGLGIGSVIREFVDRELQEGSLVEIPLREPIPSRSMGLIYSPAAMTPAMELFMAPLPGCSWATR